MQSIAAFIHNRAIAEPNALATQFLRRGENALPPLTLGELDQSALNIAGELNKRKLNKQPVILLFHAGYDFIKTLLGCFYAGVIAVPAPLPKPGNSLNRLISIINDTKTQAILGTSDTLNGIKERLKNEVYLDDMQFICVDHQIAHESDDSFIGFKSKANDIVLLQYTSGSTRDPRGVVLNNQCLLYNANLIRQSWRIAPGTTCINWMPHFHDMALLGLILYPLLWKCFSVQMAPLAFVQKPIRWLKAISQYGATLSGGPGFAFDLCARTVIDDQLQNLNLSTWHLAFCGAEAISHQTMKNFIDRFAPVGLHSSHLFACYGLAEASLFVAGDPYSRKTHQPEMNVNSQIYCEPCRLNATTRESIKIVKPETHCVLEDGKEGEIWVRSESVGVGYLGRHQESDDIFGARINPDDGNKYLRTGDRGYLLNDFLFISGRLKDTLLINGANIAAPDVEWLAATQHPNLNPYAAAVFHANKINQGKAVLLIEFWNKNILVPDKKSLSVKIRSEILREFHLVLEDIQFLKRGTLPRTTSGKIKRQEARRLYIKNAIPGQ